MKTVKQKLTQKGNVYIAVIVFVVMLTITGLVFWYGFSGKSEDDAVTPTPTPTETTSIDTSDWKTYTNEDWGYRIKYPNDWFIRDSENNSFAVDTQSFSFRKKPEQGFLSTDHLSVSVINIVKEGSIAFESWNTPREFFNSVSSVLVGESVDFPVVFGLRNTSINMVDKFEIEGKQVLHVTETPASQSVGGAYDNTVYYILDGERLFYISFSNVDYYDKLSEVANLMINSIRFVGS